MALDPHHRAAIRRERQPWVELLAVAAGLLVGTGIAAAIAWQQGTLHYFIGGF
jgi:hypothetical protein